MEAADRPVRGLLSDLAVQLSTLFRQEMQLARAEVSETTEQVSTGAMTLIAGAVLGLASLIVLLQALVVALTNAGIPAAWSALIVGAAVAVIAFALVKHGTSQLKVRNLAPRRTARALRTDAETLKDHIR